MITARLIILFCLLSLNQAYSQRLDWPVGMYTTNSLNQDLFRPLVAYFDAIENTSPLTWVDENSLYVSRDREVYFRVNLKKLSAPLGCQKFIVNFSSNGISSLNVTGQVCGVVRNINLKTFFSGSFLMPFESYYLDFGHGWPSVRGEKRGDGTQTIYTSSSYTTNVIHNQIENSSYLLSELYYECPSCDGDPVVLKVVKSSGTILNRFMKGFEETPISAKEFFSRSSGYLSFPKSFISEIVNYYKNSGAWPKPN